MYTHSEYYHNLKSPREIVPLINEIVKPLSVVDVGCGIGTFLYCFKEVGVKKVLGIDGKYINRDLLKKYLTDEEFMEQDLEKEISIVGKYDLAVCLEVAEHLKAASADFLVDNLCKLSNVILFSAAFPGQGGQNHVNEQWPSYWTKKFAKHNFIFHDILRPYLWHNSSIDVWYRQNIFLVTIKDFKLDREIIERITVKEPLDCVHPEIFNDRMQTIRKVFSGNLKLYMAYAFKKLRKRFVQK